MNPTWFFPIFNEDYFLRFRPFPEHPKNLFEKHWHEIAFSALFYFTVQALSPIISKKVFGKTYTDLPTKSKINFDIHVVSQVQCIISLLIIIPCWNHPFIINHAADPESSILGYTPYHCFAGCITTGYFIWDVYVCSKYYKLFGLGFLIHGVAALYVFGCGVKPFLLPWLPSFLLFELSTPFVNMNWFASKLPAGTFSETFIAVNGLLLIFVFFVVRIVWGIYAIGLLIIDFYAIRDKVHPFFPIVVIVLNMSLNVLNIYWFSKMINIAIKKIYPDKTKEKKEQ